MTKQIGLRARAIDLSQTSAVWRGNGGRESCDQVRAAQGGTQRVVQACCQEDGRFHESFGGDGKIQNLMAWVKCKFPKFLLKLYFSGLTHLAVRQTPTAYCSQLTFP